MPLRRKRTDSKVIAEEEGQKEEEEAGGKEGKEGGQGKRGMSEERNQIPGIPPKLESASPVLAPSTAPPPTTASTHHCNEASPPQRRKRRSPHFAFKEQGDDSNTSETPPPTPPPLPSGEGRPPSSRLSVYDTVDDLYVLRIERQGKTISLSLHPVQMRQSERHYMVEETVTQLSRILDPSQGLLQSSVCRQDLGLTV
ncbi:unnamed protein product [Pleuronectes platessa]|uniref:Uncharacterized protein n=1 Tax=Pleuronectes platessa TaxID=8262 RepID=A0A9N7VE94_PLEPL|nr:unnamed protein product [Pleuronectes platessa]